MKKSYFYALVSVFFWSTTTTVSKLLLHSISTMQVLAVSSVFATLFLLMVNVFKGNLKQLKSYRPRDYLVLAGVGFLGMFLYRMLLFFGVARMLASQAMIVNYLWPIMAVLASCVILREKLTVRKAIAVVMSFLGVVIVTTGGNAAGLSGSDLTGTVLVAVAAVFYGLFVAINKRLQYDSFVSMMFYNAVAAICAILGTLFSGETLLLTLSQNLGLVWVGVCNTAIGFVAWDLAMKTGDTAKVANLAYITPFLSLVVAYFLLGDPITIWSVGGLTVIVAGILLQLKDK